MPGSPARRYGVGSPQQAMRAQVVIVPARAPAQAWFGVANRLIARGYGVWLLDPQPFPADAAELRSLVDVVVRPGDNRRLVVLGEAEGAQAVLAAGGAADLMVLWSPRLEAPPEGLTPWAIKLGLGRLRDPRFPAWREGAPAGDPVAAAWMEANPSLRPLPPSFEQQAAMRRLALAAQTPAAIKAPAGISGGDAAARAACTRLRSCTPMPGGVDALLRALDALTAKDTPSAPPVRKAKAT